MERKNNKIQTNPNAISQYYIAYFDILGYKEYFYENTGKEQFFLEAIHDAISNVKKMISTCNISELGKLIAEFNIKVKIFSDNF